MSHRASVRVTVTGRVSVIASVDLGVLIFVLVAVAATASIQIVAIFIVNTLNIVILVVCVSVSISIDESSSAVVIAVVIPGHAAGRTAGERGVGPGEHRVAVQTGRGGARAAHHTMTVFMRRLRMMMTSTGVLVAVMLTLLLVRAHKDALPPAGILSP